MKWSDAPPHPGPLPRYAAEREKTGGGAAFEFRTPARLEKCRAGAHGRPAGVSEGHSNGTNDHPNVLLVVPIPRTSKRTFFWSFQYGELAKGRSFGRSNTANWQKDVLLVIRLARTTILTVFGHFLATGRPIWRLGGRFSILKGLKPSA